MGAMAALQPPAEGHRSASVPSFQSKSFSSLFSSKESPTFNVQVAKTMRRGAPTIVFSLPDLARAAGPFHLALVGKFSRGQPAIEEIRKFFNTLDLKAAFSVGLLDHRHVIIHLNNEHDFHRIWVVIFGMCWAIQCGYSSGQRRSM